MEDFGDVREERTPKDADFSPMELPHGIPDSSTFFRVFQWVNPKTLTTYLYE
jgi:hypothetical protein